MHAPPQLISLPGQLRVHPVPLLHTSPLIWQLVPALPPLLPQPAVAPQCVPLVVGSMHSPPQFTSVPGQVTWQPVDVHTSPRVVQF
jgi:hypothetical protein